jgi:hypothetical protein
MMSDTLVYDVVIAVLLASTLGYEIFTLRKKDT